MFMYNGAKLSSVYNLLIHSNHRLSSSVGCSPVCSGQRGHNDKVKAGHNARRKSIPQEIRCKASAAAAAEKQVCLCLSGRLRAT